MQTKAIIASAALASSALAFPFESLFSRQSLYGDDNDYPPTSVSAYDSSSPSYYVQASNIPEASYMPAATTISTPNSPSISSMPSVSGIPIGESEKVSDGIGLVSPGDTSIILCPISRTVTITSNKYTSYTVDERVLSCPDNGASYETLPFNGPQLMIHGGNLCTSNIAQYYLWSSRMYENLWLVFGSVAASVPDFENCNVVDGPGGQVARCVFSGDGVDYNAYYSSVEAEHSYAVYPTQAPVASYGPDDVYVTTDSYAPAEPTATAGGLFY